MSTRCNIEIYDDRFNDKEPGVILYHHSDGYPEFMDEKLNKFMKKTFEYLKEADYPYWWDSKRVGAVLIALSIEDYTDPLKPFSTNRIIPKNIEEFDKPRRPNNGVPVFQPCLKLHRDIDYIWRIHLKADGEFSISYE
jgi:hypothetical protein